MRQWGRPLGGKEKETSHPHLGASEPEGLVVSGICHSSSFLSSLTVEHSEKRESHSSLNLFAYLTIDTETAGLKNERIQTDSFVPILPFLFLWSLLALSLATAAPLVLAAASLIELVNGFRSFFLLEWKDRWIASSFFSSQIEILPSFSFYCLYPHPSIKTQKEMKAEDRRTCLSDFLLWSWLPFSCLIDMKRPHLNKKASFELSDGFKTRPERCTTKR